MLKKRGERDTLPALIELTVLGGDKCIKINLLYRWYVLPQRLARLCESLEQGHIILVWGWVTRETP